MYECIINMIVALFGGRPNIEVAIFFVILIEREFVFIKKKKKKKRVPL